MANDRAMIDCGKAEEQLQEWLDGGPHPTDAALKEHLARCRVCHERFSAAEQMLLVLPPRLSVNFADKVTIAVERDHRRRVWQRYLFGVTSLAAAILLGVWLTWPKPKQNDIAMGPPAPSFEKQMARATGVVRAWTDRTVQTIPLPEIRGIELIPADGLAQAFEPAAATLADAGKGLAEGFEPLASSAKRAATKFWRDLPIGD